MINDIDYLNGLNGKTVATACLEPEEGNPRRWVAVLTFTDNSRVTFMADIDCGVVYVATLEKDSNPVTTDDTVTSIAATARKTFELEEKLKAMDARITWKAAMLKWYVQQLIDLKKDNNEIQDKTEKMFERVAERLEKLEDLAKPPVTKSEDDCLFAEAMGILRSNNKPNKYDVAVITGAAKKYKREIANSKEFTAWCIKWRDELLDLMGGV